MINSALPRPPGNLIFALYFRALSDLSNPVYFQHLPEGNQNIIFI